MLEFKTNRSDIESELLDEIKLFFPYAENCEVSAEHIYSQSACGGKTELTNVLILNGRKYSYRSELLRELSESAKKRLDKRECKLSVFKAFSDFTGIKPPWGSLTGIRPSKLVYDMMNEGLPLSKCADKLCERFCVTPQKAELIVEIVSNQRGFYIADSDLFNLYIHIPFCPTKCNYCSFTTELASKCSAVIPVYLDKLKEEITDAVNTVEKLGKLHSVYVGGGTPTVLEAEQLYSLLADFPFRDVEFTVEAGRPDSITDEKLDAIKRAGANRICVNPQTLNDRTLKAIGRSHTAEDFYSKYRLAEKYGFTINVDLIAGLTNETLDDFIGTLDAAAALNPDNITVHTLSRKNGSELKQTGIYDNCYVPAMTGYALEKLGKSGYIPYYLYRQKQMLGNLENVGYCKPGKQCINNITTMEDCMSVIACGAGSITKAVSHGEKRIARFADLRDVKLYIERFDEKSAEKRKFCQNQFTKIL